MAGILDRLNVSTSGHSVQKKLHLEFIRFRRFLENMREILRHIEDARDKLDEEYIFDRHYVLSLVDGVLEEASLLAFNASVLAPSAGSGIYAWLDAQKKFAREEFLKTDTLRTENISSSRLQADPETQWLDAVLHWLTGPLAQGHPSLLDFVRKAADEVMGLCRKEALVAKAGPLARQLEFSGNGMLKIVDFSSIPSSEEAGTLTTENIPCRPFGMLALGLLDQPASGQVSSDEIEYGRWMLMDEENISLRANRNDAIIHLEATLDGNVSSDFVFLYFQNPPDLKDLITEDAWIEKTERGTMAWIYDAPTERLEKQLMRLGSALLCRR